MENFNDFTYKLEKIDDYGKVVDAGNNFKKFENSKNNNLISESSLNRLLSFKDKEWAIISANKANKTKKENIQRNRILRGELNKRKMGVHQLIGHWKECTEPNVKYKDCPKNKLVDSIERSYFVIKPDEMTSKDFVNLMIDLLEIDGEKQDGFMYHPGKPRFDEEITNTVNNSEYTYFSPDKIYLINDEKEIFDISGDKIKFGKGDIAQFYSQLVKKPEVSFTFEGMEIPSDIMGARLMNKLNIQYIK